MSLEATTLYYKMTPRGNESTASTTAQISTEIVYNYSFIFKYIGTDLKISVEQKLPLLNVLTSNETETMFKNNAHMVIFAYHEIRMLKGLLPDYQSIISC